MPILWALIHLASISQCLSCAKSRSERIVCSEQGLAAVWGQLKVEARKGNKMTVLLYHSWAEITWSKEATGRKASEPSTPLTEPWKQMHLCLMGRCYLCQLHFSNYRHFCPITLKTTTRITAAATTTTFEYSLPIYYFKFANLTATARVTIWLSNGKWAYK